MNRIKILREKYFSGTREEQGKVIDETIKCFGWRRAAEILRKWSTEKRTKWYRENKGTFRKMEGKTELENAFEIVLFRYFGLKPEEVPIVEKSDRRIMWRSFNPCEVPKVCKLHGVDTREFCKKAYEKPTQILFQLINPNIKFGRNYEKIRPYAEYCEEFIELIR